ncbi:MAG: manganese efflux pump [Pseudomonadota bacterium]|nr:manganese efflux pump [Pseudomonadota bacterium]
MLKTISFALIANIDVFLLLSLAPSRMKLRWLCIVIAPFFHILMCLAGWGVAAQIRPWVPTAVFISVFILFIIGGILLTKLYQPGQVNQNGTSSIMNLTVIIFFASLDAFVIGYAYYLVNTQLPAALISMGLISTGAALTGYFFSYFINRIGTKK